MHKVVDPAILYFGNPVVLLSSLNEDGTSNLAPMSSVFWLGWRCMLGLTAFSKTTQNMIRTRECVINLPSVHEVVAVNRLALTTGFDPVPAFKRKKGYRHVHDKFSLAGLTAMASQTVMPQRVKQCPVHLEAHVKGTYELAADDAKLKGFVVCFEVCVQRVHIDDSILCRDDHNKVDPNNWRPLIMNFQRFYGLGDEVYRSDLATIPESSYRS